MSVGPSRLFVFFCRETLLKIKKYTLSGTPSYPQAYPPSPICAHVLTSELVWQPYGGPLNKRFASQVDKPHGDCSPGCVVSSISVLGGLGNVVGRSRTGSCWKAATLSRYPSWAASHRFFFADSCVLQVAVDVAVRPPRFSRDLPV